MKRLGFILLIVLLVAGAGLGIYFLSAKISETSVSPVDTGSVLTPSPPAQLIVWNDPAGFTFRYPEGAVIDKHDEDQENYAHVELTHPDHPGSLVVWAKDTTSADVTSWVRTEKQFAGANVLDTTLGDSPAKKILIASPAKKIVTGTIADELLFMIETVPTDDTYWPVVHDTITSNFAFIPVAAEGSTSEVGAPAQVGQESVDEEEVIE